MDEGTILVVDDEQALLDVVTYNLAQAGYRTLTATDGREGLRLAQELAPDLVVLDLMLPGLDGLTVCRALREKSPRLPIVLLTARDTELDKVLGLETGADDYVTKPFSPRELVARVRALLRRSRSGTDAASGRADSTPSAPDARIDLGRGLSLDRRAREVSRRGLTIPLTPTEYRLLELLVEREGQTLSRGELFNLIWGEEAFGEERTVDVHIRHLREKLEEDASHPSMIVTVRGFGYRFRLRGSASPGDGPPEAGGQE